MCVWYKGGYFMIELNVFDFCQNCGEFYPILNNDLKLIASLRGECHHIVECENKEKCLRIMNSLQKEMKNNEQ